MGKLSLVPIILLVAGCAMATTKGYEQILASWLDKPEAALIEKWGPPDSVYESGETRYLTYQEQRSVYVPGIEPSYQTYCSYGSCYTTAIGGSPGYMANQRCKTTFKVSGGKITQWRWQGNACRA